MGAKDSRSRLDGEQGYWEPKTRDELQNIWGDQGGRAGGQGPSPGQTNDEELKEPPGRDGQSSSTSSAKNYRRLTDIEKLEEIDPELIIDTSVKECEEYISMGFAWNHGGHEVRLVTSADQWTAEIPLTRTVAPSGKVDFSTVIELPPGLHWYKFVVDGTWACARDQPYKKEMEGGYVNYIECRSLSQQSFISEKRRGFRGEFAQNFDLKNFCLGEPPVAPPHLGNIMLNVNPSKGSWDPCWESPASHVVINHLYLAQSKANDVISLGMTDRYEDKQYTTVYLRPNPAKETEVVMSEEWDIGS